MSPVDAMAQSLDQRLLTFLKLELVIVLIDRRNHHIFQPLLYQVATSVLAPSEIAAPIPHRPMCWE